MDSFGQLVSYVKGAFLGILASRTPSAKPKGRKELGKSRDRTREIAYEKFIERKKRRERSRFGKKRNTKPSPKSRKNWKK